MSKEDRMMEHTEHFLSEQSRKLLISSPRRQARLVPWKSRLSSSVLPAAFIDGDAWTDALQRLEYKHEVL
jgi:hypothetical protein